MLAGYIVLSYWIFHLAGICFKDVSRTKIREPESKSISGVTFTCSDTCTTPFGIFGDDNAEVTPYIDLDLKAFMRKIKDYLNVKRFSYFWLCAYIAKSMLKSLYGLRSISTTYGNNFLIHD